MSASQAGEPIGRHQHDVHMIGHQAVGPHLRLRPPGRFGQQIKVESVVCVLEERALPSIGFVAQIGQRVAVGL